MAAPFLLTQAVAMVIYIIFPTRQDLRPEAFPRDNVLTQLVSVIYAFDTNTGVCPSLYVAYSLGILSIFLRDKTASKLWKVFLTIDVLLVCLSARFVKQHSAADVFAALPVCALAEYLVFGEFYRHANKTAAHKPQ